MNGDFKSDFTRDSFDPLSLFSPLRRYSRVLMQQGRVQLDADWNEQTDILLRYLRTLARDIIGPHGGPSWDPGLKIDVIQNVNNNFAIAIGDYYVDGILIENDNTVAYVSQDSGTSKLPPQPFFVPPDKLASNKNGYLVYMDVWERQVTFLEDDFMREVALGVGRPDTATRAQVVWQVKVWPLPDQDPPCLEGDRKICWTEYVSNWQRTNHGWLKASVPPPSDENPDVCITPPDARYRGAENQLYRVEVHTGGSVGPGTTGKAATQRTSTRGAAARRTAARTSAVSTGGATFKWSRENGSVVFPIVGTGEGNVVTLANLGRDDRFSLQKGDWVEFVDDDYILQTMGNPQAVTRPLLHVNAVDPVNVQVTLSGTSVITIGPTTRHPLLRRWDQKERSATKEQVPELNADGTISIVEGTDDTNWLTLEDGIQIQFQPPGQEDAAVYRPGDYWLIPARTITGNIEWPQVKNPQGDYMPAALRPQGIAHHYAPLALISIDGAGVVTAKPEDDMRYVFKSLTELSK